MPKLERCVSVWGDVRCCSITKQIAHQLLSVMNEVQLLSWLRCHDHQRKQISPMRSVELAFVWQFTVESNRKHGEKAQGLDLQLRLLTDFKLVTCVFTQLGQQGRPKINLTAWPPGHNIILQHPGHLFTEIYVSGAGNGHNKVKRSSGIINHRAQAGCG